LDNYPTAQTSNDLPHHMRDRATLLAEVDRLKVLCGRAADAARYAQLHDTREAQGITWQILEAELREASK
jgi:hypothetical protein